MELRRKLRKRFDNVVNIDIKKIGKHEEREEKEEIAPHSVNILKYAKENCRPTEAKGSKSEPQKIVSAEVKPTTLLHHEKKITRLEAARLSRLEKGFKEEVKEPNAGIDNEIFYENEEGENLDAESKQKKKKAIAKKEKPQQSVKKKTPVQSVAMDVVRDSIILLHEDVSSMGE
jgi:hypothetical protein